jgi:hypothetical protein
MTSLYLLSIPVLIDVLKTISVVLKKGEAFARDRGITEADFLNERVYPDMFNLRLQIVVILIVSRNTIGQLSGKAVPDIPQRDQTLAQLHSQIDETMQYLTDVKREDVDGKEDQEVSCIFFEEDLRASAREYVQGYTVPTVYFHLSVLYSILRGLGFPVGKKDYACVFMRGFKLAGS